MKSWLNLCWNWFTVGVGKLTMVHLDLATNKNWRKSFRKRFLGVEYKAICEMLGPNASEFGWNDENKCIMGEAGVFEEWVKVDFN